MFIWNCFISAFFVELFLGIFLKSIILINFTKLFFPAYPNVFEHADAWDMCLKHMFGHLINFNFPSCDVSGELLTNKALIITQCGQYIALPLASSPWVCFSYNTLISAGSCLTVVMTLKSLILELPFHKIIRLRK